MLAVVWMTLLCATTGASESTNKSCSETKCSVHLNERNITAQAGTCVVFKCPVENCHTLKSIAWYNPAENCNETVFSTSKNEDTHPEFRGWVLLVKSDVEKNCSIIIKNLNLSDSKLYEFRVTDEQNNAEVICKVSFKVGTATKKTETPETDITTTPTVSAKDHDNVSSRNDLGEETKNSTVNKSQKHQEKQQEDLLEQLKTWLTTLQEPKCLIVLTTGILIGIFFSAIITCLVIKCHRKKSSRNLVEDLEMVTTQTIAMVENDGIHDVEAAEGEAEFAELLVPDDDMVPKETEYSNIDFFALKKRDSTVAEEKQKTTETEYAEINTGGTDNRQKDGEEDSEMLEGEDEDQVIINEDEEAKENKPAEDVVGEDVQLYSTVKDIVDESADE
ncbi:uncharacterized protein PAE49_005362 isoform 1-T2 [Odontesthes bonariensis]|uniref:uncharacterized protein LOC142380317 n=1 Tax=Odontesthes bonariensis TaxID=219752 RepID=UPI003F58C0D1